MSDTTSLSWMGPLSAFCSSITWAVGSTAYSRLAARSTALSVNFARALFSLPLFLAAAWLTGASFSQLGWDHLGWFSVSVLASYAIGDALFFLSARSIGVPGALAIASIFPIWTALVGATVWGETLSMLETAGLLITILGVVIVILNGPQPVHGKSTARSSPRGIVFAFATSVLWAVNNMAIAHGARDIDATAGNSLRMVLAIVVIAVLSKSLMPKEGLLPRVADLKTYWWVFIVEAFFGSYFFVYGLSHSTLALGAVLASLSPVISVPIALALGLEKPSLFRTLGICVTVGGLCLLVGGKPDL